MPVVIFIRWTQTHSLLKTLQCLVLTAKLPEDPTQGIIKICIFRCSQTLRSLRRRGSAFLLASLSQSQSQIELRLGFLRIQFDRSVQVLHCLFSLAGGKKKPPQREFSHKSFRLLRKSGSIAFNGCAVVSQPLTGNP